MRTTRRTAAALALAAPLAVGAVAAPSLAFADTATDTTAPAVAPASSASTEVDTDSIESLEKQLEAIYNRHSDLWDKVFEEAVADLDGQDLTELDEQDLADLDDELLVELDGEGDDGEAEVFVLEGPDVDEKALVDASTSLTQEEKATLHKDIDEADAIEKKLVALYEQQEGDAEEAEGSESSEETDGASAPQEADNA